MTTARASRRSAADRRADPGGGATRVTRDAVDPRGRRTGRRSLRPRAGVVDAVAADLTDDALAWHLARSMTGSEEAARRLLAEARQQAEALIGEPSFRAVTERLALELLRRGSLDRETVAGIGEDARG